MTTTPTRFLLASAAVAGLVLTGCQGAAPENSSAPSTAPTQTATTPAAPKHIDAALYWFGPTLDPAVEYDGWTVRRAGVGENLVTIDENLEIVPEIAESWEMVNETTWKFRIREGVTFHNGEACDAEAVKASFERVLGLAERAKTSSGISEITVDGQDVIFTTAAPNASFLNAVSEPLFTIEAVGDGIDYEKQPIGTGPFKVTGFEPDVKIELAAYEGYWNGASDVATVTVTNVADDTTRAMALQSGDLDIVQRIASADLALFQDKPEFAVADTRGIRTRALQFNYDNAFLADANVRKALAASLDYETLATVLGPDAEVAGAPFPTAAYGYPQDVPVCTYDKDAATAALTAAGFSDTDGDGLVDKDGKNLELSLTYDLPVMTPVNEAIQDMAKQVGIGIELKLVESLDDIEANRDFVIKQRNTQWLSTGDPVWLLTSLYHSGSETNYGGLKDDALDAMVDELNQTFDQTERAEKVKAAQTYMLDNAIDIYSISQSNVVASKASVSNVLAHPIDYYFLTNKLTINE